MEKTNAVNLDRMFPEGNRDHIMSVVLENPLNIPNWTLQRTLFDGMISKLRDLRISQDRIATRLELSDDFFEGFHSLQRLQLDTFSSRIPRGLASLNGLQQLYISNPDISSGAHLSPESNIQPNISDFYIARFESKPFSGLKELLVLELSGLTAPEIPEDLFVGLNRVRELRLKRWSSLSVIEAGTFSNTLNLRELELQTLPLLDEVSPGLFQSLGELKRLKISNCGLKNLPSDLPQSPSI